VRSSKGSPAWSLPGVSSLIKNRVYLGEARSGKYRNPRAHEPILTQAEFDAAQSTTTLLRAHDGSVASKALLGGLARCAGCGHTLKIARGIVRKTGERFPVYYCHGRYAKGTCQARATIRAAYLDRYVEAQVLRALADEGGLLAQAVEASEHIEEAARRAAEAEHELDLYVTNPKLLTLLNESKFLQGLEARQHALDQARATLAELRSQSALANELTEGNLLEAWPTLTTPEKRRLLHGRLDRVVLRRDQGRARKDRLPIDERTQIVLRGNVVLEPQGTEEEPKPV
jgi:site-specific DNA recombinase